MKTLASAAIAAQPNMLPKFAHERRKVNEKSLARTFHDCTRRAEGKFEIGRARLLPSQLYTLASRQRLGGSLALPIFAGF